jgi:hypothetical protein
MPMKKRVLTAYAEEQLGYYVYALRNPLDGKVFYIGKGVGRRVLAHANGVIGTTDLPDTMKVQTIQEIHTAGLEVESFIVQHGLRDDDHAFQTESAVYGILKLLDQQPEHHLFTLTNLIQPPTFEDFGLMSVEDVLAMYGEPADGTHIPHNSVFIKPTDNWRKGMSRDELWEASRGWWTMSEDRLKTIRYVFAIPNFVIRAAWEVKADDWRRQGPGDRGWEDILKKRELGSEKRPRNGFTSCVDVSETKFAALINKSVAHTFLDGQGRRANVTYLDDGRVKDLRRAKEPREPFWNVTLR